MQLLVRWKKSCGGYHEFMYFSYTPITNRIKEINAQIQVLHKRKTIVSYSKRKASSKTKKSSTMVK